LYYALFLVDNIYDIFDLFSFIMHIYAPAPEQPLEDLNGLNNFNNIYNNSLANLNAKKRPWESPSPLSAAAAALRKKRMKNIYEEEEATCAKCHYRRKYILSSTLPTLHPHISPFSHILTCSKEKKKIMNMRVFLRKSHSYLCSLLCPLAQFPRSFFFFFFFFDRKSSMKCINCFARFCEQRCLPRYLEDPAAQVCSAFHQIQIKQLLLSIKLIK
jgi:hypothetical protein